MRTIPYGDLAHQKQLANYLLCTPT